MAGTCLTSNANGRPSGRPRECQAEQVGANLELFAHGAPCRGEHRSTVAAGAVPWERIHGVVWWERCAFARWGARDWDL